MQLFAIIAEQSKSIMKFIVTQSLAYLLILASCQSNNTPKPFEFENSSKDTLANQLIVLKRAAIEEQTGAIDSGFISLKNPAGVPMVIQFDDLNGDGKWD